MKSLIRDRYKSIVDIAEYLDGLDHERRVDLMTRLTRKDQSILYKKAAMSEPLDISHFVPDDAEPLQPIHHSGWNSLPVTRGYRKFEKRFARSPETGRVFGYNETPFSFPPIGPGYFVVTATDGNPVWERRGAIVVDYFEVPNEKVPNQWPSVVPNSQGLQRFVYNGTRDFMRRVSSHVSIGAAFKGETQVHQYFVLTRP